MSGKVLMVGGNNNTPTELYDPVLGTWSNCSAPAASKDCPGPLHTGRTHHTATLLASGKVLVAGGDAGGTKTTSSELYDPATGTWSSCSASGETPRADCPGPMNVGRSSHTATRLSDGEVLAAGGGDDKLEPVVGLVREVRTERYDPATGKWTLTAGRLNTGRAGHTATLLDKGDCADNCGRVLVTGDRDVNPDQQTAELYAPPPLDLWVKTNDMNSGRRFHTATLLPTGEVLVVGGDRRNSGTGDTAGLKSTELWNPRGELWTTAAPLTDGRSRHTATLLPGGKRVLVVGGRGSNAAGVVVPASPELYGIAANTWTKFAGLTDEAGFFGDTATLLPSGPASACATNCGKVLLTRGAVTGSQSPSSAALYTPPPEVTKVSPASGPAAGGTAVTIEGTGLASATRVTFGDAQTTNVTPDAQSPDTKLVAVSPPHAAGTVPVTVTTSGGTSTSGATTQFSYVGDTSGGTGSGATLATTLVGGALPSSVVGGALPSSVVGGALPSSANNVLAAMLASEARRASALRSCLADAARRPRGARRMTARARRRAAALQRAARQRCLKLYRRTPGRVTGLTARAVSSTKVALTFTASGTDGSRPPAARSYVIKQSLGAITSSRRFARGRSLCGGACRYSITSVGTKLTLTVTDLRPHTTYYYAVAARDNVSSRLGPRSETANAKTR